MHARPTTLDTAAMLGGTISRYSFEKPAAERPADADVAAGPDEDRPDVPASVVLGED